MWATMWVKERRRKNYMGHNVGHQTSLLHFSENIPLLCKWNFLRHKFRRPAQRFYSLYMRQPPMANPAWLWDSWGTKRDWERSSNQSDSPTDLNISGLGNLTSAHHTENFQLFLKHQFHDHEQWDPLTNNKLSQSKAWIFQKKARSIAMRNIISWHALRSSGPYDQRDNIYW